MIRQLAYVLAKNEMCLRAMVTVLCMRHSCRLQFKDPVYVLSKGRRSMRLSRKHLVYSFDMARNFDIYFPQVQPTEVATGQMVDFSGPQLHTLANGLQFELSSFPEELPTLDSYFRFSRPNPGDIVFDVGAYCGVFTYELSRLVGPGGKVIAFEPDPLNFALLRRNIARHGLENVVVLQAALSDKDGTATFSSEGTIGSALTQSLDRPAMVATIAVETMTLQSACSRYGTPTFIKVDAEGSEIEILSSAIDFLRNNPIPIVLDTNHKRGGKLTYKRVELLLSQAGYKYESSAAYGGQMTTWTLA